MSSLLLRRLFRAPVSFRPRAAWGRAAWRRGSAVGSEVLDDRMLLTAYLVDTLADAVAADGRVSLREAIQAANTNAGVNEAEAGQSGVPDSISFAASLGGGTIRLAGTQLTISGSLNIGGLGASRLAVSGEGLSRVFEISTGAVVEIRSLMVTGGNVVAGNYGGGVYNHGSLAVVGCVVRDNAASYAGGGIANGGGTLSVSDSGVLDNEAQYHGGGLYNEVGIVTLARDAFSGNKSPAGNGGGIHNGDVLTISGSTLSGNEAGGGGGIYNVGTMTVVNATLSGNAATGSGGGLTNGSPASAGTLTLRNVTIFGNRADSGGAGGTPGGGIYSSEGPVTLRNTLVAGNVRGTGTGTPDDVFGGLNAASSYSLIADASSLTTTGLTNGTNGNIVGANVAALLDPVLRDNGGPTLTHKLLVGSRAIDAGNSAQAVRPDGGSLATDQRGTGFQRVLQTRVDIGAFEAAPATDLVGYSGGGWWVAASTGTAFTTTLWAKWADYSWDALGQADFTGDGRFDTFGLVDGAWWIGTSTGSGFGAAVRWTLWSNLDWQDVKAADLNFDGKADILARVGNNWWAAVSTGTGFLAPTLWASWAALPWREFFATDVTGDRRADLVGYQHGQWWVGVSNGTSFAAPKLFATWTDAVWQKLLILDADGDGRSDVAGFLGGGWRVGRSTGAGGTAAFTNSLWAQWSNVAWSDPLVGDFDGDGKDEVAARNGGSWWVGTSNWTSFGGPTLWGGWSDVAWVDVRAGDFDGDGKDDLTGRLGGQWWVARSTGAAFTTTLWGTWSEAAWRAVGAVDATGHIVTTGAGSGGAFSAASRSASPTAIVALRVSDDEPLRLFWSKSQKDEEYAGRLLAG